MGDVIVTCVSSGNYEQKPLNLQRERLEREWLISFSYTRCGINRDNSTNAAFGLSFVFKSN